MSITRLWRVIVKQHGLVLLLILLVGIGLSAFDGVTASKNWHSSNNSLQLDLAPEKRSFEKHQLFLKDANGHNYRAWNDYLNDSQQVYQKRVSTQLNHVSDRNSNGIFELLFVMIPIASVYLVTGSRKKYFSELLQGFGYSKRQIFNSSLSIFGLTIMTSIAIGEISKSLILYSTIPNQYFKYFDWQSWFGNLVSYLAIDMVMFLLGVVLNLVISNYLVVVLLAGFLYLDWSKIVAIIMLRPVDDDIYSDYFSRHWEIGMLTAVALMLGLILIGNYLNRQYSNELQNEPVTIPWLKPVVFGLFGIFGTLSSGHFLEKRLLALPIFASYLIAVVMVIVILVVWLYRPRWSRRLWELTAALR